MAASRPRQRNTPVHGARARLSCRHDAAAAFWQGDARLRLTPFQPKALYLSFYGVGSQTIRDAALKLIHDAKLNAVVIDVKGDRGIDRLSQRHSAGADSGSTAHHHHSRSACAAAIAARTGIYTIARIVVFKDDPLATPGRISR